MLSITKEYERRALKSKGGKKDDNTAFYSNDAEKGQKGGSSSKWRGECHNCGRKGHWTQYITLPHTFHLDPGGMVGIQVNPGKFPPHSR